MALKGLTSLTVSIRQLNSLMQVGPVEIVAAPGGLAWSIAMIISQPPRLDDDEVEVEG
jgi:hypothetical protein